MKKQRLEAVSELDVLETISDRISLDIFSEIGMNAETSDNLIRTLGITNKQYYARSSKLMEAGLIRSHL